MMGPFPKPKVSLKKKGRVGPWEGNPGVSQGFPRYCGRLSSRGSDWTLRGQRQTGEGRSTAWRSVSQDPETKDGHVPGGSGSRGPALSQRLG